MPHKVVSAFAAFALVACLALAISTPTTTTLVGLALAGVGFCLAMFGGSSES